MKQLQLDDIDQILGRNIIPASIIYLPSSLVATIEDPEKREMLLPFLDRAFLIEKEGKNYFLADDGSKAVHQVLKKPSMLKDNVLRLLQYRERTSPETFGYILDHYFEIVSAYSHIAKWLAANAGTHMANVGKILEQAFDMQADAFAKHELEIMERFSTGAIKVEDRSIGLALEENSTEISKMMKEQPPAAKMAVSTGTMSQSTMNRKRSLSSETIEGVEREILETIFNIKCDADEGQKR